MGRLLGDPEIWDDSPARPRPAARGLAGLAIGAGAGRQLLAGPNPAGKPIRALSGGEQQRLTGSVR